MSYDKLYRSGADVFGGSPEDILVAHWDKIPPGSPVLDIGAGQGRNCIFLAGKNYHVHALDTCREAVNALKNSFRRMNFPGEAYLRSFENWDRPAGYSAVLLFGLIPDMGWEEIHALSAKARSLLREGGLLFVTAFTTGDDSFPGFRDSCRLIGKNSFLNKDGGVRTYLEPGELPLLFPGLRSLTHIEAVGPRHSHAGGAPERHFFAKAVMKK